MTNRLAADKWINASCLQKAIRRNHVAHAQMAAKHLLAPLYPSSLIRRLSVIAVEDTSIRNRSIAAEYLTRTPELMENPSGVMEWVAALCAAPKSRRLCELAFVHDTHPALVRQRMGDGPVPARWLWQQFDDSGDMLARYSILRRLPFRDVTAWAERLEDGKALAEAMRCARRMKTEGMEVGMPLVWHQPSQQMVHTPLPEPELIGGYPDYAFDRHTRVGQQAYRLFLRHLLEIDLPPRVKLRVVGLIVFFLESALLDREAILPDHEAMKALLWEAITPEGYGPDDMAGWVAVVQERLPLLAGCRRQAVSNYL